MNVSRIIILFMVTALAACKVEIEVPTSGSVATNSNNINCAAGQTCSVDVSDIFFNETFVAQPAADFVFTGWKMKPRGFCGGSMAPCNVDSSYAAGNAPLTALLNNPNEIIFLAPGFQSTGFKVIVTGNSFVSPIGWGIPDHATTAGIASHDHNQVTSGGATGAPEALWNNATKGPQIRAIIDGGDVDLFIMTALPATLNGYRLWIDYLLAENPDTRVGIVAPWIPTPATFTSAEYETTWNNFHAVVHQNIDTLRSEYPGVEIFCVPYGASGVELRALLDAGNLPDVTGMTSGNSTGIFVNDNLGHADPILRDLSRLVLVRGIYDVDMNNFSHNPGYITDLKALAQSITDAHDPVYDAPYR
ncbi:MAG: hypothetical protein Hals2KO_28560 [Halioglobus sp.]